MWYLFLCLGALWTEATDGAFLRIEFRISLWLVLLETLGTFSLQLVREVMKDAHTVFHRLVETKGRDWKIYFHILFKTGVKKQYGNWQYLIHPTCLVFFGFIFCGKMKAGTSIVCVFPVTYSDVKKD